MASRFGSSRTQRDSRNKNETGTGGKVGATLFLSIFFLMGMGFLGLMVHVIYQTGRTYTFTETDCVIESSSIAKDMSQNDPYTLKVKYHYVVNATAYSSDIYSTRDSSFSDYSDVQRLKLRYASGAKAKAYYNSSDPSEAVLAHGSLFMIPFIIIPLIFVVIGGFGIYAVWFGKDASEEGSGKSISDAAPSKVGSWGKYCLAFFFFIFLAAGVGVSFPLIIMPVSKHINSQDWTRAPAVVESSRVKSHRGDDSTTYSVDILFAYQVDGQTYRSNNYDFSTGSSSGHSSKQQVVDMYPAGMQFKCFVNPADPTDAVVSRSLDTTMLLFGILPLIFILIGGGGMYAALTGKMQRSSKNRAISRAQGRGLSISSVEEAASLVGAMQTGQIGTASVVPELEGLPTWAPEPTAYEMLSSGEVQLNPSMSAKTKIIGMTVFAVIWNAIIGGVLYAEGGSFSIFMMLFFVPFALVGLACIAGVFYFILAASNAKPTLTLKSIKMYPDVPFRVRWNLVGKTENITKFTIKVKGVEEATYRRGTNSYTDRETFYENTVVAFGKHADIRTGSVDITLPQGVMHSFACNNNKVKWSLEVHGDIDKWPDVKEEFTLLVMPTPMNRGA